MTKRETKVYLKSELKKMNDKIDKLIWAGKSYVEEARQHMKIKKQLNSLGVK